MSDHHRLLSVSSTDSWSVVERRTSSVDSSDEEGELIAAELAELHSDDEDVMDDSSDIETYLMDEEDIEVSNKSEDEVDDHISEQKEVEKIQEHEGMEDAATRHYVCPQRSTERRDKLAEKSRVVEDDEEHTRVECLLVGVALFILVIFGCADQWMNHGGVTNFNPKNIEAQSTCAYHSFDPASVRSFMERSNIAFAVPKLVSPPIRPEVLLPQASSKEFGRAINYLSDLPKVVPVTDPTLPRSRQPAVKKPTNTSKISIAFDRSNMKRGARMTSSKPMTSSRPVTSSKRVETAKRPQKKINMEPAHNRAVYRRY